MTKFYSGKEIVRVLQRVGFWVVSQKGSHLKLRGIRMGKLHTVIVPMHKEVAAGTFQSNLNQAAMDYQEFLKYKR